MAIAEDISIEGLADQSYESLRSFAIQIVNGRWRRFPADAEHIYQANCRLAGRRSRMRSRAFHHAHLRTRSAWERAFAELFLTSRLGNLNLAFLKLQEGATADFRGARTSGPIPGLNLLSQKLGRRSMEELRLNLRWRTHSMRGISLDPFVHARSIYARSLKARGRGTFGVTLLDLFDRAAFKIKIRAIRRMTGAQLARWRNINQLDLCQSPMFRSVVSTLLELHKAGVGSNTKLAASVAGPLSGFVSGFGVRLVKAVVGPNRDAESLAKFLKMILAVVVWRAAAYNDRKHDLTSYVVASFRLAVAWGATYPLVDDVIDDGTTGPDGRRAVAETIGAFTQGQAIPTRPIDNVKLSLLSEAFAVIQDVLGDESTVRRVVALVAESHLQESSKRLSDGPFSQSEEDQIYADTLLKSFLVRLATMIVSGLEPTSDDLKHGIDVALFNQLGDDLIDLSEDLAQDRVTPFTIFHAFGTARNPYLLYQDCVQFLGAKRVGDTGLAAVYSCLDTFATALDRQEIQPKDGMRRQLDDAVATQGWRVNLNEPEGVFCIDPDTALHLACSAVLDLVPSANRPR